MCNSSILGCKIIVQVKASEDSLVEGFEAEWKPEIGQYSKKFVEYCSIKALTNMCQSIEEKISDGSFSRLTFDMMLAWEMPSAADEESHTECMGKENEDRKAVKVTSDHDEIPLFYTDIMPLLVNNEPSVGEDAFVWMGSLVPLVSDVINGRFTYEILTAPTGNRLHSPAYDIFLKEMDKCIKHLQKQATPKGVELADDEFILHVEGTASTQRVVRHIGKTSWPGRLTLTNYALYFEASGVITYEDALKIDLSKDAELSVKPTATGPWGAPLFDKAIVVESPEQSEGIVLEFPEITSSTRRDHWLALTKEIMLMHKFLSKFKVECPIQAWEMNARTILCIIRLHAAREMLRILPPDPTKFLIFALYDELPKGDYVLEELAESLKKVNCGHPSSASSILRCMNLSIAASGEVKEGKELEEHKHISDESCSSLETAINQSKEQAKAIEIAKSTTEGLKDEGISDSILVLLELLKPLKSVLPWIREVVSWEKPATTLTVIATTLLIVYKEWVGQAIAACLLTIVVKMLQARKKRLTDKCNEIVVCTASDQSTVESIVSAQYSLITIHEMLQAANIMILKIWSILISKARKHADTVMVALTGLAIVLAVVPFKYIVMGGVLYGFIMNSKPMKYLGNNSNDQSGNRRLKEWWESIPIIPVRVVDKLPECPK
ncbi:ArgH [Citrus sinensis]|uniref:ArgH n=1 Tax=Citrus sinensis TaxID=2711 RepID=A0ACB8MG23_CITSI|nr:ArgH [Citrus sinensis]